ncbi:MAG: YsnF/AvaK domain-containing protein [Pirellulaceae bacterium]
MVREKDTLVGVFDNREYAQQAVRELKQAGFREDQIGIATRSDEHSETATQEGSLAEEGAIAGVATGAGIGGLWALGIAAGFLPAIGPVIAGGILASLVASAAAGAAVGGLAGALIGLGIPEEEAEHYEQEFRAGRTIVTVKPDGRYQEALAILRRFGATDASMRGTDAAMRAEDRSFADTRRSGADESIELHEEQLDVHKDTVKTGEVRVRKEVHTEHQTLDVPVKKEEVVIERHPVTGHEASSSDFAEGDEIRVPVTEEQVHVEKKPVAKERVNVSKREVKDTERVEGTVRKEDIRIDQEGDVDIDRH